MIKHVPELIEAGIQSFKIEGRVKTEYYVSTIIKAYRDAIDAYFDGRETDQSVYDEILKVSHREYTTGFFFGNPREEGQVYGSSSYIREYDLVGIAEEYDKATKTLTFSQRNKFCVGDTIEILKPRGNFETLTVESMTDEKGERIENCPHPMMKVKINCPFEVPPMSMLRKKKE